MYIDRNISEYLKKRVSSSFISIITGSRQVGKSTLLRHLFPDYTYVTFDNIEVVDLAINDQKAFFKKYKLPLIIDEFQYAPNILHEIKIMVDMLKYEEVEKEKRSNRGLFILTGSQRFETMKNVQESLAGRVSIINLYGLTNREIKKEKAKAFLPYDIDENYKNNERENIFNKIFKGSYPEVQDLGDKSLDEFFLDYINTYIERDIKNIIGISDKMKFIHFMRNVASITAQELNLTSICDGIGISSVTANKWLSLLVDTNIVYLLEPYYNNHISRLVKRPKLHFFDTGLCANLAGYHSVETLERSAFSGAIFETYVVTEIIKSHVNAGENIRDKFFYLRNNNGIEIDLLIMIDKTLYPIEIKKAFTPKRDSIKNFSILNKTNENVGRGLVICNRDDCFPIADDNIMIPAEII